MKNSRNITLFDGKYLTNSYKRSGDMTKLVCQEFTPVEYIHVRQATLHAVVENMTIAYCPSALVFHAAVNVTLRNVIITNNYSLHGFIGICLSTRHTHEIYVQKLLGWYIFSSAIVIGDINSKIRTCSL